MQLSKMASMRFTVTFYEEGAHSPRQNRIKLIKEAAKLASEKCARRTLIRDLPITASEFAVEACLLNGLGRPLNGHGYEQAMAAAAAESGLIYSDGMLLKIRDASAAAVRRTYDSAIHNGGYALNKIKSASRFLSANKIMTDGATYADITKAVASWGRARVLCNGCARPNAFQRSETEIAGLVLLRLCGKLKTIVL
jgi:hypothetical protein